LLEQDALNDFLPLCEARRAAVVVGGGFNSGILATGASPGAKYNYSPAPQAIFDKVAKIEAVCASHSVPLPAAALQFVVAHPAIPSFSAGTRTIEQLKQNLAWFSHPIPQAFWADRKAKGLLREEAPVPVRWAASYAPPQAALVIKIRPVGRTGRCAQRRYRISRPYRCAKKGRPEDFGPRSSQADIEHEHTVSAAFKFGHDAPAEVLMHGIHQIGIPDRRILKVEPEDIVEPPNQRQFDRDIGKGPEIQNAGYVPRKARQPGVECCLCRVRCARLETQGNDVSDHGSVLSRNSACVCRGRPTALRTFRTRRPGWFTPELPSICSALRLGR